MNQLTEQLLSQFKALADPVRARLVSLCGLVDCSVSELTQVTGQSQPRVSQHLKQLCAVDLLERFKDGHFVYYRVKRDGVAASARRRLLALLPEDEPQFEKDVVRLRELRAGDDTGTTSITEDDRSLHRALVELTVAKPLGDLLDIGCGQGRILKLLASRAQRAVGVDIDSDARMLARAELLLAGTPNTTLRQGDMTALSFQDGEFDTIILDDVFGDAENPGAAVLEAKRLLAKGGRLIVLASLNAIGEADLRGRIAELAAIANLRLAAPRAVPSKNPRWLLASATIAESKSESGSVAA